VKEGTGDLRVPRPDAWWPYAYRAYARRPMGRGKSKGGGGTRTREERRGGGMLVEEGGGSVGVWE
jgi:hypothetical protein